MKFKGGPNDKAHKNKIFGVENGKLSDEPNLMKELKSRLKESLKFRNIVPK